MPTKEPEKPSGMGYCKKCRKRMPLDEFALVKSGTMDICERCYSRTNKQ